MGVIVDSIPNSGFFKWAIPSLIRTGIRAIRIQTTDNKVWGDSAPFLIESKSPSTGTVHRAPPAPEGPFVTVRLEIIDIINNYRKSKGLNPLSFNNCLWLSAQKHAEWISNMGIDFFYDKDLNQKYNSHDEPSGTSWVEGCTEYHLTELDYPFVDPPVATLAQRTFDGWKKSEDHNTLMLLKERTKIGVGIAKGDYWYSITARLS